MNEKYSLMIVGVVALVGLFAIISAQQKFTGSAFETNNPAAVAPDPKLDVDCIPADDNHLSEKKCEEGEPDSILFCSCTNNVCRWKTHAICEAIGEKCYEKSPPPECDDLQDRGVPQAECRPIGEDCPL